MWGNIKVAKFLKNEEWYEIVPGKGYVATSKMPKEEQETLDLLNKKIKQESQNHKISLEE